MAICTILSILDLSPADAVVGEVMDGRFFFSVEEPIKEGTLPTVAIVSGSSAYPQGYHVGDGGGLPAIDVDLATANIKSGETIFNIAGDTDVRDVSDADAVAGEVKTGSTFYAVGGARKTGSGTQTLNPANENVVAGYYVATTLSAVDGDLAVGNIKKDVNIFGKVGTYDPAITTIELFSEVRIDRFMNVGTTYATLTNLTGSVPAGAVKVQAIVTAKVQDSASVSGTVRILYNGVEKNSYAIAFPCNRMSSALWEGNGIGSGATLEAQAKVDSSTANVFYNGVCWYQTI